MAIHIDEALDAKGYDIGKGSEYWDTFRVIRQLPGKAKVKGEKLPCGGIVERENAKAQGIELPPPPDYIMNNEPRPMH